MNLQKAARPKTISKKVPLNPKPQTLTLNPKPKTPKRPLKTRARPSQGAPAWPSMAARCSAVFLSLFSASAVAGRHDFSEGLVFRV